MRSELLLLAFVAPLGVAACSGAPRDEAGLLTPAPAAAASSSPPTSSSTPDAGAAGPVEAGEASAPSPPPPIPSIPPATGPALCAGGAAPPAYLIAMDWTIFSFDPRTLALRALGKPSCMVPESWPDQFFGVSASGAVYIDLGADLERIDLSTMQCSPTPFAWHQLGFTGPELLAFGAGAAGGHLYDYGSLQDSFDSTMALGVADLTTFQLLPVGGVAQAPASDLVDLTMDAYGRLFALSLDGTLAQLDPGTGAVVGVDQTGFDGHTVIDSGEWAMMPYGAQLYFFTGDSGELSSYDVATKVLQPLGQVNQAVFGAAAVPCVAASPDAGMSAGDAGSGT